VEYAENNLRNSNSNAHVYSSFVAYSGHSVVL